MERKKKITIGIAALAAVALIGGGVGYTMIENNAKQAAFKQANVAYSEADKAYSGMQTTAEKSVVANCSATVVDAKTCAALDEALKQAKDLTKPSEVVKGKSKKEYNELKTALAKNKKEYEKLSENIASALEQVKASQKAKTEFDKKTAEQQNQPQAANNGNTGGNGANYNSGNSYSGGNSSSGYSGGNGGSTSSGSNWDGIIRGQKDDPSVLDGSNGKWKQAGGIEWCEEGDEFGNSRIIPCP